ncbi:MAG: cytochrome c peroxidase [Chloroflexota bacterium]
MKHKFPRQFVNQVRWTLTLTILVSAMLLTGCQQALVLPEFPVQSQSPPYANQAALDADLRVLIAAHALTGDPSQGRNLPSIHSPIAQLGKKLFFTKAMGGDMDVACVSCHHPQLGGGDGLSLSIGVGAHNPDLLGPGRTRPEGTPNVPRNAPTTFNIALWDEVLFWDGRVESLGKMPGMGGADGMGIRTPDVAFGVADPLAGDNLAMAQSRFPVTSVDEMRGEAFAADGNNEDVRNQLAKRLSGYRLAGYGDGLSPHQLTTSAHWLAEFERVFTALDSEGPLITEQRIAFALAEYERSQIFVESPWKAYVQGNDSALSESAKRGAWLFYNDAEAGGANCASCHTGDFFTDEQFHTIALPQIGPGKELNTAFADFGRYRETGNPDDLYTFRTPTLLNVEVTGPYGHDGAYTTLEGIVRHHLNPIEGCTTYDMAQLDPMIQTEQARANTEAVMSKLLENREQGLTAVEDIPLTNSQIDDLVSFLHALTDPCVKDAACLAPWLPYPGQDNFDTNQLMAQIPSLEN